MNVDQSTLVDLLKLQHVDIELMRAKKRFEELPHRQQILEIRKKKQAIEDKRGKVAEMKRSNDQETARLKDEDDRLAAKQDEAQEKISSVKGDYRTVESYSKELNGVAKRRATLESDLRKASEQGTSIAGVATQIDAALATVTAKEQELIAAFQKEGGDLNQVIASYESEHTKLAANLPADIVKEYDKVAKRSGGIAVARLSDAKCSVCRNAIEGGKLIQVQAEAPLSICPACKRLLVVQ